MSNQDDSDVFTTRTINWTEEDVGKRIEKRVTPNGTYFNEMVVLISCQFCGSAFIGPAREAGGFIGGHECYHAWEYSREMGANAEMTE